MSSNAIEQARVDFKSFGAVSPATAEALAAELVAKHAGPHMMAANSTAVGAIDWTKVISMIIADLIQILPLIFGGLTPPSPPFPPTVH